MPLFLRKYGSYKLNLQLRCSKCYIVMICLLGIVLSNKVQAARYNLDSLHKVIRTSNSKTDVLEAYLKLAKQYNTFQTDSSVMFCNAVLKIASANKLLGYQILAHKQLGETYLSKRLVDSARNHYLVALSISEKNKFYDGLCMTYSQMSEFYHNIGKQDSSLYCLLQYLSYSHKASNPKEVPGSLNLLGNFYSLQGNFSKARSYLMQSLKLWQKLDPDNTAGILSDIGNTYYNENNYPKALEYYKAAYAASRRVGDKLGYAYTLNNIALVYMDQKQYDSAIAYSKQALYYYHLILAKDGIAGAELNISRSYSLKGDYSNALPHVKEALIFGKQLNDRTLLYSCYSQMAKIYDKTGDYKSAYECQRLKTAYADSLNDITIKQKTADLQAKYESSQKEAENKALRADEARQVELINRQRLLAGFIGIVLFLSLIILLIVVRYSNQQKHNLILLREQNQQIQAANDELARLNEEALDQKTQLETANAFKDKLFSIVSHDFRSPLISLQSFLFLLDEVELTKEELQFMSKDLLERVNVTYDFLENLLSWAKSQMKGYTPELQLVNIHAMVDKQFELFNAQALAKTIRLYNHVSVETSIMTDVNMIKLVLRNLISNAIKFSQEHKQIMVTCYSENEYCIINVEDNGLGMSENELGKLFIAAGHTTLGTADEKGSGIGLKLCKEFVEINGGKIWAISKLNEGSTFSFSIPERPQVMTELKVGKTVLST